jgi:DNA-binding PadR family transcriptional regulator
VKINTDNIHKFILKNYRNREFYGYQLQKTLAEEGYEIDITRLYKILNNMNKEDLLTSRWDKSREGPQKKMYKLGEKGNTELKKILLDAISTVHSFYGDYLFSLRDKVDVFNLVIEPLIKKIVSPKNIGFFYNNYTPLVSFFFLKIRNAFDAQYYFVKPRSIVSEEYSGNVVILNGEYYDVPLRDAYLDALIMIDLPDEEKLNESVKEWSRILKADGVLSILTPSILIKEESDPLSIGDFVEKNEHHIIEKGAIIYYNKLCEALSPFFFDVEENSVVHISVITCKRKR